MAEYIDKEKALKELEHQRDRYESHDWVNLNESLIHDGYEFAITDIEYQPAADVIEREKIDKAIQEIKSLKRFELRGEVTPLVNIDSVVDILKKHIE